MIYDGGCVGIIGYDAVFQQPSHTRAQFNETLFGSLKFGRHIGRLSLQHLARRRYDAFLGALQRPFAIEHSGLKPADRRPRCAKIVLGLGVLCACGRERLVRASWIAGKQCLHNVLAGACFLQLLGCDVEFVLSRPNSAASAVESIMCGGESLGSRVALGNCIRQRSAWR
jgi:hypothetical protein